jgi:hypothetical protein
MKKKWKRVVDNKMRGAYGETNFETQTIRINKTKHTKDNALLIDTIVHEEIHRLHPKMHEKTVRKLAAKKVETMSQKTKNRYYSRYV